MTRLRRGTRGLLKAALAIIVGSMLFGQSCGSDMRDSFRAAGLDFVKSSTNTTLQQVFPIKDIVNAILHPPAQ